MKLFLKYAVMSSMFIMAVSLQGCLEEEELPKVTAGFTYTANEDTGTVTFLNISDNATKYLWDFGDSQTSKEIDPVKTYMSGTYIVTLTASNVSGGADIFKDTLDIAIRGVITIPATFDNPNINYDATAIEGAVYEVVDNPDQSGTNNKATKVASITNNGTAFEGVFWDLGTQLDLTTNKRITMNFWADAPIDVLLKLEQGTSAAVETSVAHGGTGWESLSFDFTSSAKYSRLTLFVDGPGTKTGTFYLDDIEQELIPSTGDPCEAETVQSILAADFNLTHKDDIGATIVSDNAAFAWVDNPDFDNAVNKSCKVGRVIRTGTTLFDNNNLTLDAKLDFTTNAGFKMKVFSDLAGYKATLKLEDKGSSGAIATELEVATTKTGEWEELTFPFASGESNKYDKIVIFFDLNTNSTGTYYFDDLALYASGGGGPTSGCTGTPVAAATLPLNFEGCETFLASENFGGGITSELAPNPSKSGINTSNFVLKVDKPTGSDFFAGIQNTFTPNFDLTTTNVFKLKVYSTKPNVTFRFELVVDPNPPPAIGNPAAVFSTITNANQWTEVEFTFTGLPGTTTDYNRLVIKPDNDMSDSPITSGGTYYIDDITLTAGGSPSAMLELPIDFDDAGVDYATKIVGNVAFTVLDNPELSGINNVNTKVGRITNVGANWENAFFNLDQPIDFATDKTVTLKLYSTQALPIKLKFEDSGDVEADANHGGTGWEELTFTFASSSSYNDMVIFVDGPGTAAGTFYVDDIVQVSSGGGGGGGSELTTNGDFEAGDVSGWSLFLDTDQSFTAVGSPALGSFSGNLVNTKLAAGATVKQANLDAGSVPANTDVEISFQARGATANGGVLFAQVFTELSGGGTSSDAFVSGGPLPITDTDWTTFTYTFNTGTLDVSGGITLQFNGATGGAAGSSVNVYIDNVTVKYN